MPKLTTRETELLNEIARLRRQLARSETKEYGSGTAGGATTFLGLTDTPSAYTGSAGAFLRVGAGTASVVFGTVDYTDLYNVPTAGTSTLGVAAFSNGNFIVAGGTASIGTVDYSLLTSVPSTFAPAAHTIGSHSDASIAGTASGDVLAHNGTNWVDEAPITTSAGAADASKLVRLDADGQIDATMVNDADINLDNVTEGTTNKFYTATEQTKLSGIETAADVTDAGNVGSSIHGATAKTTPVDADTMPLIDSAASNVLKKVTWANIKATLKTYFDTLYNLYVHPNHSGDVTSVADGATTIANNAVTNAKLNDMATATFKGRTTAGTGDPEDLTVAQAVALLNATLDHGTLAGLTDDDHTQYVLLLGRSGGQVLYGGTAANNDITIEPTSNATKTSAYVLLAPSGGNVGIGTSSPAEILHINGNLQMENNGFVKTKTVGGTVVRVFGLGADDIAYFGGIDAATTEVRFRTSGTNRAVITDTGARFGDVTAPAHKLEVVAGGSTNDAAVGGVLYSNYVQNANSGTSETDLASYTLPASTLAVNGQRIRVEAWGQVLDSAPVTTLKFYTGATSVTLYSNNGATFDWHFVAYLVRTGAATQRLHIKFDTDGFPAIPAYVTTTRTLTLSSSNVIKFTGQSASASDDIATEFMEINFHDYNT